MKQETYERTALIITAFGQEDVITTSRDAPLDVYESTRIKTIDER